MNVKGKSVIQSNEELEAYEVQERTQLRAHACLV